ncbi:MAG: hypothetical protein RL033_4782, partial [Pseudomonadota bacterium]
MKDPLVTAGLRALREEMPSEESCRAALARLGLSEPAPRKAERAALTVERPARPLPSAL